MIEASAMVAQISAKLRELAAGWIVDEAAFADPARLFQAGKP